MSERSIKDLGVLEGPIWCFGGIYSNLEALKAFVTATKETKHSPKHLIFTGDSVAYCADANASIDMLLALDIHVLKGNCDAQLASQAPDCGCGFDPKTSCAVFAKDWYAHALGSVPRELAEKLGEWPDWLVFEHNQKRYAVLHGAPSDVAKFLWPSTDDSIFNAEIKFLTDQIGPIDCVISGHSGIPFRRHIAPVEWINAGVIGMPAHDGDPRTVYGVLDQNFTFERLAYDPSETIQKMAKAGLVQGYERSLETGYWPSEESLPEDMRGINPPADGG